MDLFNGIAVKIKITVRFYFLYTDKWLCKDK